jgi:hypothetical protein
LKCTLHFDRSPFLPFFFLLVKGVHAQCQHDWESLKDETFAWTRRMPLLLSVLPLIELTVCFGMGKKAGR